MPTSPIVLLQIAIAAAGILFALWKGDAAERAAACVVAVNLAAGLLVSEFLVSRQTALRFAADGLTALALLAVTVRYGAPWMGAMMLLYAAQFSLHAYYLATGRDQTDYLHAVINNIDFSAIVWCLIIGTAVTWRRRSRDRARGA
jgi:hypothetical protein